MAPNRYDVDFGQQDRIRIARDMIAGITVKDYQDIQRGQRKVKRDDDLRLDSQGVSGTGTARDCLRGESEAHSQLASGMTPRGHNVQVQVNKQTERSSLQGYKKASLAYALVPANTPKEDDRANTKLLRNDLWTSVNGDRIGEESRLAANAAYTSRYSSGTSGVCHFFRFRQTMS
jgi:hypothetical protein